MKTPYIKLYLTGLLIGWTLCPVVLHAQTRPEFTPEYWASRKLPDSMKHIPPKDLAAIARANAMAYQRKNLENQPKQAPGSVRPANGAYNLAGENAAKSQVVQTAGFGPMTANPGRAFVEGVQKIRPANIIPQGLRGKPQAFGSGATSSSMVSGNTPQMPAPAPEVPALFDQAHKARNSGNLQQALDAYRKILQYEPYNRGAVIQAARLEHAMGNLDNAEKAYQYLLTIDPKNAVGWNDLGLCQARAGKYNEALKSLQAAVVAKPRELRYRNNLAKVLIETNQVDQAAKVLTQIRGEALGQASVGALLAERGRNEEARAYLTKALTADPSLVAAKQKLGELGRPGAQPTARLATRLTPQNDVPPAAPQNLGSGNGPANVPQPRLTAPQLAPATLQR